MKVILIGDSETGKSEMRKKYLGTGFKADYLETIGADFAVKRLKLLDVETNFQIWDLASQSRFKTVRSLYYSGTHGGILVFDVTRKSTFDNCLNWIKELKQNIQHGPIPLILVGHNVNFRNNSYPDHITHEDGQNLAYKISEIYSGGEIPVPYFETSIETSHNIQTMFHTLAELVIRGHSLIHSNHSNYTLLLNHLRSINMVPSDVILERVKSLITEIYSNISLLYRELKELKDKFKRDPSFRELEKINKHIITIDIKNVLLMKQFQQISSLEPIINVFSLLIKQTKSKLDLFNATSRSIAILISLRLLILDRLHILSNLDDDYNKYHINLKNCLENLKFTQNYSEIDNFRKKIKTIKDKIMETQLFIENNPDVLKAIRTEYDQVGNKLASLRNLASKVDENCSRKYNEIRYNKEQRLLKLNSKVKIHLETCLGHREVIPPNDLKIACYCLECQLYLCYTCWGIVSATPERICPGSWKTKAHKLILFKNNIS